MADLAEKIAEALDKRGWIGPDPHKEQVRDEIRRVIKEQETVALNCRAGHGTGNAFPCKPETMARHLKECVGPHRRLIDGGPDA